MKAALDEILARQPETNFTPALSADQIAEFRERGFIAIERITFDDEIAWLGNLSVIPAQETVDFL